MKIRAGAQAVKITPNTSQFLCGYPHVERYSTGVDTDLYSSSVYLDDGQIRLLMIANDLVYLEKSAVARIRADITEQTAIPAGNIMVACTHTHSGPVTGEAPAGNRESAEPSADPAYLDWAIEQIVAGAVAAVRSGTVFVEGGLTLADSSKVGCNRRDPHGPSNPQAPVLLLREVNSGQPVALLMLVGMHPTVLHEDSKLVSADFPGYTRIRVQEKLGPIPVIYLTGPAGNQSPRHVTRENTVAEAKRLGFILGDSVLAAVERLTFTTDLTLTVTNGNAELPFNTFPPVAEAERCERQARARLEKMRRERADVKQTRTAECDWFGAERLLLLAKLAAGGELEKEMRGRYLPAEIQIFRIGRWTFVGWLAEIFVEFGLELMRRAPDTFPIAYANGGTCGYLVTAEAAAEGGYEAGTAIFKSPESAEMLVKTTLALIAERDSKSSMAGPQRV